MPNKQKVLSNTIRNRCRHFCETALFKEKSMKKCMFFGSAILNAFCDGFGKPRCLIFAFFSAFLSASEYRNTSWSNARSIAQCYNRHCGRCTCAQRPQHMPVAFTVKSLNQQAKATMPASWDRHLSCFALALRLWQPQGLCVSRAAPPSCRSVLL